MKTCRFSVCVVLISVWTLTGALAQEPKAKVLAGVEKRSEMAWSASLKIWDFAEPGYLEKQSSALLADLFLKEGFQVQRNVAGIPTAFTATIGSGKPVT